MKVGQPRAFSGTLVATTPRMCLAIPGEVVTTYGKDGVPYADVRFGGITRPVCLHAFPETIVGEYVLVHVGFAIAKVDRAEAERALRELTALGETDPDVPVPEEVT
jgi:hydrogenase expression/formation protein HypC